MSPEDEYQGALYRPNRRDLLHVLGLGGATALAGCDGFLGGSGEQTDRDGGGDSGGTATVNDNASFGTLSSGGLY